MTYVDLPGSNPDALEYLAEAVSRFPDRLIAFARLNPSYRREAEDALGRAVSELGFRRVKLHPTTTLAHPAHEPTVALLQQAAELGVPALFHCGDDPYTTPQAIAAGARQAPDTAVVLGHMGGYFHVDDAIAMAERHPTSTWRRPPCRDILIQRLVDVMLAFPTIVLALVLVAALGVGVQNVIVRAGGAGVQPCGRRAARRARPAPADLLTEHVAGAAPVALGGLGLR